MSILAGVTHTSQSKQGIRFVIGAMEKVGKTTLACNAPRPLLVPLEIGFQGVSVHKTPMLESFDKVMELLIELENTPNLQFQSLIIDSTTALERLIHQAVLMSDPSWAKGNRKALTMESALGGYGKAYQYANELFANFLAHCDWLVTNRGMNIILTCHVFPSKVLDPAFGEYDSWDLLLHSPKNMKAYGKREMITQWADMIGYLHEPVFVKQGETMNQGISANKGRILGLSRTPGYVAGNRFHVTGEIPIPREGGWNHIAKAVYDSTKGAVDIWNRD
jgi:hypothetical protein